MREIAAELFGKRLNQKLEVKKPKPISPLGYLAPVLHSVQEFLLLDLELCVWSLHVHDEVDFFFCFHVLL